jgi:UDPglucose 6-dehydrogenase
MDNARQVFPTLQYADSAEFACRDADLVLHLTEWLEFRELDPVVVGNVVRGKIIIDGRNCLDVDAWRAAGWAYHGLGRP